MKLISMTDFVLEQRGDNLKYAKFLKQPLNLGMFVPCDENNKVLQEPKRISYSYNPIINEMHDEKVIRYKQAKERVLFEGFEDIEAIQHHVHQKRTIEYFSKFNTLTLTKSAQKQLGL